MTETVVEAKGLTKYYGAKAAVDGLSFSIPRGIVYALVGRNGAGKTTAMQTLLGFLVPTRGTSSVFGCDSQSLTPEIRSRVGYVAEGHHLYGWMRIRDLARFSGRTHPRWSQKAFRSMMGYFELGEDQRIRSLSNGQRAQVSLAATLACGPELLVMDDPTLGVDAAVRRDFLRGVVDLVTREGRTVLFSTHDLGDVEQIADRVGIMDEGVLRTEATVDELKANVVTYHLTFDGDVPGSAALPRLVDSLVVGNEMTVTVVGPGPDIDDALEKLDTRSCERIDTSLEDIFVHYTAGRRQRRLSFTDLDADGEEQE